MRHPDFRLFACMNPATDVGKKDLSPGIRNRYFFIKFVFIHPSFVDLGIFVLQKRSQYVILKLSRHQKKVLCS